MARRSLKKERFRECKKKKGKVWGFFRSGYFVQKGIHFYSMHKAEIFILKQNHSVFLPVFRINHLIVL